jgi:hypothetical protein
MTLSFAGLVIVGCKKENKSINDLASPKAAVAVEDGKLVFANLSAFDNLMRKAHEQESIEVITNFTDKLAQGDKFVSLTEKAEMLNELNTQSSQKQTASGGNGKLSYANDDGSGNIRSFEQQLEEIVYDPYFASVLSPQGQIEVNNTLYTVSPVGTIVSEPEDSVLVKNFTTSVNNGTVDLTNTVQAVGQDLYQIVGSDVVIYDTYGQIKAQTQGAETGTPSTVVNEDGTFNNVIAFEFNDAQTWAGKAAQYFFGRVHFNYYKSIDKRRFRVNFFSTSWVLLASTGVTSNIQKEATFSNWRTLNNFDEMRITWKNISIKLDVPVLNPLTPPVLDFFGNVKKGLQKTINFGKTDYLIFSIQDILDLNRGSNFLGSNLYNKLISIPFDGAQPLEFFLDKVLIDLLVKEIKYRLTDKTQEIAFTTSGLGHPIDQVFIPSGLEKKLGTQTGAHMDKIFDWKTAQIGISQSTFIMQPAQSIKIMTGEIFALGKLNGEWRGISVAKK